MYSFTYDICDLKIKCIYDPKNNRSSLDGMKTCEATHHK